MTELPRRFTYECLERGAGNPGSDMYEYLKYESARTGLDVEAIYREEMAARKLYDKEPFTADEIKSFVETSTPNPRLLAGKEECPF